MMNVEFSPWMIIPGIVLYLLIGCIFSTLFRLFMKDQFDDTADIFTWIWIIAAPAWLILMAVNLSISISENISGWFIDREECEEEDKEDE